MDRVMGGDASRDGRVLSADDVELRPERQSATSRRRALKWMIRVGYGAFALAFVPPAVALRTLTQAVKGVASGDVLVYATGDQSGARVDANAIAPGAAVQAFPEGKSESSDNLIQVVRLADPGGVVAYSAICTHLGCTVLPNLITNGWIACPCHGSVFDPAADARVVAGPAGKPLPSLPVQVASDGSITAAGGFSGEVGPN